MRNRLHGAAGDGDSEVIRYLHALEVNLNAPDHNGFTPLHHAAICGQPDSIRCLHSLGANINAQKHGGLTPSRITADIDSNKLSLFSLFGSEEEAGHTPLHCAAQYGHVDSIRFLLSRGANISAEGKHGHTPLHFAAQNGHVDAIKCLHSLGADINAKNNRGRYALTCRCILWTS